MKKIGLFLCLLFISTFAFAQIETQEFEKLNIEKVMADIDTIKQEMDSTFYYINATLKTLKEEVELFGLKKTIQMNSDIFSSVCYFQYFIPALASR